MCNSAEMEQYLTLVENCLLNAAGKVNDGKQIDVEGIQVLLDGVRIFHHIKKMRED